MSDDLHNYFSSLDVKVQKDQVTGEYGVTVDKYNLGTKTGQDSFNFDITPSPEPEVIEGIYQKVHRGTYGGDTYVRDRPLDLNTSGDNGGLQKAFANCTEMGMISVSWDVKNVTGGNHSYAFYGCRNLSVVNIYNRLADSSLYDNCSYVSMFEGCKMLSTVIGLIDVSHVSYENLKDMFKDCHRLTGLRIKNGTGNNDILAENVVVNGVTYAHAYEIMGLSADQFEVSTPMFRYEELIPEEELGGLIATNNPSNYKDMTSVLAGSINYKNLGVYYTDVFANCTSLQSIDLQTVVTGYDYDYKAPFFDNMFYYDLSLTSVNLRDAASENDFARFDANNSYVRMFYGCQALTTISGTIDFTDVPTENGLHMFSGCQQLNAVTIKNGTGNFDITRQNVEIDGITYNYAYEALGLTAYQMENVVTLV